VNNTAAQIYFLVRPKNNAWAEGGVICRRLCTKVITRALVWSGRVIVEI
jgi:hypothetical protein